MNAKKSIAAAAVFVATGSVFAADAPAVAAVPAAASATVIAAHLAAPTVSASEVRAEALEFVKNYKTAITVQLEQYK